MALKDSPPFHIISDADFKTCLITIEVKLKSHTFASSIRFFRHFMFTAVVKQTPKVFVFVVVILWTEMWHLPDSMIQSNISWPPFFFYRQDTTDPEYIHLK